jgi:HPr kinase/phosphorylase
MHLLANVTCVSVEGRGLLIEGPAGSGKSSLALALIDRGGILVGDDGVMLERREARLWAHPPPNIAGKLEIRGVGIIELPMQSAPLALVLALGEAVDRLPMPGTVDWHGVRLPRLGFRPDETVAAIRAEWALRVHGIAIQAPAS